MKFKKKPIEIEAIQWKGTIDSFSELVNFANVTKYSQLTTEPSMIHETDVNNCIHIQTLEGEMRANVGDWIIKGIKGEFYPCESEIFDLTYDKL